MIRIQFSFFDGKAPTPSCTIVIRRYALKRRKPIGGVCPFCRCHWCLAGAGRIVFELLRCSFCGRKNIITKHITQSTRCVRKLRTTSHIALTTHILVFSRTWKMHGAISNQWDGESRREDETGKKRVQENGGNKTENHNNKINWFRWLFAFNGSARRAPHICTQAMCLNPASPSLPLYLARVCASCKLYWECDWNGTMHASIWHRRMIASGAIKKMASTHYEPHTMKWQNGLNRSHEDGLFCANENARNMNKS